MEAFGGLAGIGVLVGGIGFAYSQFRLGGSKAKDELITTLRQTAEAEREKARQIEADKVKQQQFHQKQINQLNEKIGKLQGLYEESKERSKEYLTILQGRSPEQVKFMETMTTFATEFTTYMKSTNKVLTDLSEDHKALLSKFDKVTVTVSK